MTMKKRDYILQLITIFFKKKPRHLTTAANGRVDERFPRTFAATGRSERHTHTQSPSARDRLDRWPTKATSAHSNSCLFCAAGWYGGTPRERFQFNFPENSFGHRRREIRSHVTKNVHMSRVI